MQRDFKEHFADEAFRAIPLEVVAALKHKQHKLANYMKQIGKEKFDKGAEVTRATIVNNLAVICSERYLSKIEKFIISSDDDGVEKVRQFRVEAIRGILQDKEVTAHIERIVEAKILCFLCDSFPQDEKCVIVLIFDRQLANH